MIKITQKEANDTLNGVFVSFQRWRSIEAESDRVGLFDNPKAEQFFQAVLKLVNMNRNIEQMELYNLAYMGEILYPAIGIILVVETGIDLKKFLGIREFQII